MDLQGTREESTYFTFAESKVYSVVSAVCNRKNSNLRKLKDFSSDVQTSIPAQSTVLHLSFSLFSPFHYLAFVKSPTPYSLSDFQALLTIYVSFARLTFRKALALRHGFNRYGGRARLFIYRLWCITERATPTTTGWRVGEKGRERGGWWARGGKRRPFFSGLHASTPGDASVDTSTVLYPARSSAVYQ